jgi:hypothetical protein
VWARGERDLLLPQGRSGSPREKGLDASTDRGLTERNGEVFLLDILSHRMSVTAIFHNHRG